MELSGIYGRSEGNQKIPSTDFYEKIENKIAALSLFLEEQQSGITHNNQYKEFDSAVNNSALGGKSTQIGDFLGGLSGIEPTEKQKAARAKLDEKQSSTGVKYKDAKAVIKQLTKKYQDLCRSVFEAKQDGILAVYRTYEAFDPLKLPEPDKSTYFCALASVIEIEEANFALLAQAGLEKTPRPELRISGKMLP